MIYNKQPVRNIALELEARGGAVAVPKLTATLPGDLVLQAKSTMSGDPNRPNVAGEFSLVGPKLRETLAWLAVDVSAVPPAKLTRLSMKGKMSSNGGNVAVSDAVFELDDLKGTGGITVTFSVPLAVVTQVSLDTLDLDSFLVAAPADKKAAPAGPSPAATAPNREAGPSVGLKAKVAKLIWHKETIGGVDIDIALRGSTLRLNDVKVANLAGARLAVRGTIANYNAPQPRPDIAFNFEAPDTDRVLKLVGATPAGLGALTASGGVAGSLEQLSLREFTVSTAGQSLRATGSLALPGAAQGSPKSASYKGSLTLNGQTLEGSIEATLAGRPNVTADLKAGVLDLDKIGGCVGAARAGAWPAGRSRQGDRHRSVAQRRRQLQAGGGDLDQLAPAHRQRRPCGDIEGRRAHHLALQGGDLWRLARPLGRGQRQPARARARFQGRRHRHQSRRDAAQHGRQQPVRQRHQGDDRRHAECQRHLRQGPGRHVRSDPELDGGRRDDWRLRPCRRRQGTAGAGRRPRPAWRAV